MNRYLIAALAGLLLVGSGCKKEEDNSVGGKGGNATLRITPKHHIDPIDSCTVYIRYNVVDAPADGKYDDSSKCAQVSGLPVALFTGLKKGKYYLYGYGWDPSLNRHVKGGTPYVISEEKVLDVNLPVTEE